MLLDRFEDAVRQGAGLHAATGLWLRPYQLEGLARCDSGNVLLAFDCGLGKTAVSVATMATEPQDTAKVIVAPMGAFPVWRKELVRWGGWSGAIELAGVSKPRALAVRYDSRGIVVHEADYRGCIDGPLPRDGNVFLMSHESVNAWAALLPRQRGPGELSFSTADVEDLQAWAGIFPEKIGTLVVDEAHRFGSPDAKRTSAALTAARAAERVILLTGTPTMGGVQRLWPLLKMLDDARWESYFDFIVRYAGATKGEYGLQPTVATNVGELSARMEGCLLQYRRHEVASYLPKHTAEKVIVPMTKETARLVGTAIKDASKVLADRAKLDAESARARWQSGEIVALRIALGLAKAKAVAEYAAELMAQGEKVVIWSWHRDVARAIAHHLLDLRAVAYVTVTGETQDQSLVRAAVERWATHQRPMVLNATIGKLGEAVDLTAACWQLFAELDWVPEAISQAVGRLLRLTQTRPVDTRFFSLDLPFEQSFCDRLLGRAFEGDEFLATDDMGPLLGQLFSLAGPALPDTEALARLARTVG